MLGEGNAFAEELAIFALDGLVMTVPNSKSILSGQGELICLWMLGEGNAFAEELARFALDGLVMAVPNSNQLPSLERK
jgi:hypothetical protein